MADGREQASGFSYRTAFPWTNIFRCFSIALDPRKLFVAALGILAMSFSWWLLSNIFYYKAPLANDQEYSVSVLQREFEGKTKADKTNYTEEDFKRIGAERFKKDYEQWQVLDSLAGPGGRLRTLPWYEYRGPNPFLFFTDTLGGSATDRAKAVTGFLSGSVPVLIEPLVKLLLPVTKLVSPSVSPQTRLYLLLILFCNVAVWAFAGGIITRLSAIQLANKGPITLKQAFTFVLKRYRSYLGAPLVPLGIIGLVVVGLFLYGLLAMLPFFGDLVFLGVGLPAILVGGAIATVFLIGLAGYPMMYTTLSAEGDQSDTFDALSRSVNYVYQAPWHYLWNWFVAVLYGATVTLFVLFFASVTVYVGKWAVGLPASVMAESRKPEYLFIYAPESFGWKELLTKDSPYSVRGEWTGIDNEGKESNDPTKRQVMVYKPANKEVYDAAKSTYWWYNSWGAGIVCFWLTLAFLMMLGFSYSFFWSAATMIYFLMRKKVDEAELDEVFEDDEPEAPLAAPKLAPAPAAPPATSLPVITAPATPAPDAAPAPATLPFNPPAASSPPVAPPPAPPVVPPPPAPPVAPPPAEPKKPDNDAPLG
jgi:hypothetical protein